MSTITEQRDADRIAQTITDTLTTMGATLPQITGATSHGQGVVLALEVLDGSTRVVIGTQSLEDDGWTDTEQANEWYDRANRMAIDAAGRVGMDIDALEELAGY